MDRALGPQKGSWHAATTLLLCVMFSRPAISARSACRRRLSCPQYTLPIANPVKYLYNTRDYSHMEMVNIETTAERLHALFRRFPYLADGEHDKELIAKYLEVYHHHVIPAEVLGECPSFETIRRARQKFTADTVKE